MPEMKEVIMQKQKLGNIFGRILGDGKADKIMEASQESLVSDTGFLKKSNIFLLMLFT